MFQFFTNYKAINTVPVKNTLPVLHIDMAVVQVLGSKFFVGVDFCFEYWQLRLHENSQPLYAFTTAGEGMMLTRTVQSACDRAADCQDCV